MTAPSAAGSWYPHQRDPGWTCASPPAEVRQFHRGLEGYEVTPLVDLPALAVELGVGQVLAKDESSRLGLPAFKALGASWAVHRALQSHAAGQAVTLVTATDGNHGRAVARFARLLGAQAHVFVPDGVHPTAVQAIVDEGAVVTRVRGSYDDAVAAAVRAAAGDGAVLLQDTAWGGYEEIPGWIVDGYGTLFAELDEQLAEAGLAGPDLVLVPTGVGSLLQAALAHFRADGAGLRTAVVSVEPEVAACIAPSLRAGRPVTVETGTTVMAGLNCGTPSSLAWPFVEHGLDAAVSVSEAADIRAAHDLAALGLAAGPCGAASVAGARTALAGEGSGQRRAHLGIGPDSVVVLIVTEGSAANPLSTAERSG